MEFALLKDSYGAWETLREKTFLRPVDEPVETYYLAYEGDQWVIKNGAFGERFVIALDFNKELEKIRKQKISLKKSIFCKALGFKGDSEFRVVDGTAGAGKDFCHMLAYGMNVTAVEQHPITFLLLNSALSKAPELKEGLQVLEGEVQKVGVDFSAASCLYLDPMFEDVNSKAAVKKMMAFLRYLKPKDTDLVGALELALSQGVKRVVVKRPINGHYLYDKPSVAYRGKLIRYDVYMR